MTLERFGLQECVCGDLATTTVEVHWLRGAVRYRYCDNCAHDIIEYCDGTEIVPER